jgi:hypothetical protein
MTKSDHNSGQHEHPLTKPEFKTRIPRRKITLVLITLLLNVLIWSAFICLVTSLYQIVTDPHDTTNIAPVVLNVTSVCAGSLVTKTNTNRSSQALATIAYACVHTVFSLKQKKWERQRRHKSAVEKTSYIAIRLVVSLCVLWLLTSGWNMILVARRPICLQETPGLQGWEFGSTCLYGRVGITFAAISLFVRPVRQADARANCKTRFASFVLFGVLAVVNRPFEAHLFKHGYQQSANTWRPPYFPHRPSTERDQVCTCEKRTHCRHSSTPPRRSTSFDPMERNRSRSPDSRVFTSHHAPPPIPSAFIALHRNPSFATLPSVSNPPTSLGVSTRPPRLSEPARSSDSVPLFTQARYSASTWRAIHPEGANVILPLSRPHSSDIYLPQRTQYSRSSMSLTRPNRLSSQSSIPRSGFIDPESQDGHFSEDTDGSEEATPHEIAYAITRDTHVLGAERNPHNSHHARTVSAPHDPSEAQQKPYFKLDTIVITRRPVPVRQLRSADRVRRSDASISATARADMANQSPVNFQQLRNSLTSAEFERRRRTIFEEVKNKPLPKIAVF